MKQTIYLNTFVDAFERFGREDQFSFDGLVALFNYLEELEEATGEEIELDVIALCVEFTEYESMEDLMEEYDVEEPEEVEHAVIAYLDNGGLIVHDF